MGWDPTGQTADVNAPTVNWSGNLIRDKNWETDMWYAFEREVEATGDTASLWLRAGNTKFRPVVRVYVDEVDVARE